jgi:hypothetical protein
MDWSPSYGALSLTLFLVFYGDTYGGLPVRIDEDLGCF